MPKPHIEQAEKDGYGSTAGSKVKFFVELLVYICFFDHRFWPIGWFVCYHVIHMWILKGLLPLFHLATGSGFSLILIAVASSILSYTLF